jgi:hypothetical protein
LPIYRLTPRDPTDSVWRGFAFVETVWTDAGSEHAARMRVSALAIRMMGDDSKSVQPMRHWPWIYSAICTLDESRPSIATGQVVGVDGRPIGVRAENLRALAGGQPPVASRVAERACSQENLALRA